MEINTFLPVFFLFRMRCALWKCWKSGRILEIHLCPWFKINNNIEIFHLFSGWYHCLSQRLISLNSKYAFAFLSILSNITTSTQPYTQLTMNKNYWALHEKNIPSVNIIIVPQNAWVSKNKWNHCTTAIAIMISWLDFLLTQSSNRDYLFSGLEIAVIKLN